MEPEEIENRYEGLDVDMGDWDEYEEPSEGGISFAALVLIIMLAYLVGFIIWWNVR